MAGARAFGRGLRFGIQMLIDAAPRMAPAMLVLTLIEAVLPVVNVRLTQWIVNALAGRTAASHLTELLLIYLALHLAGAGLAPALDTIQALVAERLMGRVNQLLLSRITRFMDLS